MYLKSKNVDLVLDALSIASGDKIFKISKRVLDSSKNSGFLLWTWRNFHEFAGLVVAPDKSVAVLCL